MEITENPATRSNGSKRAKFTSPFHVGLLVILNVSVAVPSALSLGQPTLTVLDSLSVAVAVV